MGRGALGNPWVFRQINAYLTDSCTILPPPGIAERLFTMRRHIGLLVELKGEGRAMREARKHAGWYLHGLRGAAEFRRRAGQLCTLEDLDRLVDACAAISDTYRNAEEKYDTCVIKDRVCFPKLPEQVLTPRQAYFAPKREIAWEDAVGAVSGQLIAPYPPGIPALYAGEVVSREAWEYIEDFRKRGRHIHGADKDGQLRTIKVIG